MCNYVVCGVKIGLALAVASWLVFYGVVASSQLADSLAVLE